MGKNESTGTKGLTILVMLGICACALALIVPAAAAPAPFTIYGYVFYENGTACNDPTVNITNLNTGVKWQAETNATSNYYQLVLANGTDVNATEILQFNAASPDGSQSNITNHTVTQDEIASGGIFNFNITLASEAPPGVCGDTNGDGYVTVYDKTVLALYIGEVPGWTIESEWAADVNGDGYVTVYDKTVLALYIGEVPGWELNCK